MRTGSRGGSIRPGCPIAPFVDAAGYFGWSGADILFGVAWAMAPCPIVSWDMALCPMLSCAIAPPWLIAVGWDMLSCVGVRVASCANAPADNGNASRAAAGTTNKRFILCILMLHGQSASSPFPV